MSSITHSPSLSFLQQGVLGESIPTTADGLMTSLLSASKEAFLHQSPSTPELSVSISSFNLDPIPDLPTSTDSYLPIDNIVTSADPIKKPSKARAKKKAKGIPTYQDPVLMTIDKCKTFADVLLEDATRDIHAQFLKRQVREHQVVLTLIDNHKTKLVDIEDVYNDYRTKYRRKLNGAKSLEGCPSDQAWLEPPCTFAIWQAQKSCIHKNLFTDRLGEVVRKHGATMGHNTPLEEAYNSLRDKVFKLKKNQQSKSTQANKVDDFMVDGVQQTVSQAISAMSTEVIRAYSAQQADLFRSFEKVQEAERKERVDHTQWEIEADIAIHTAFGELGKSIEGVIKNSFQALESDYTRRLDALNANVRMLLDTNKEQRTSMDELTSIVTALSEKISDYAPIRTKAERKKNCCSCRGICSGGVGVSLANKCPCILQGTGCKARCSSNICCSKEEIKRGENVLQTGKRVVRSVEYLNQMQ